MTRKAKLYCKGQFCTTGFVMLVAILIICGLAQAQILSEPISNKINPEISAKLETIEQEVAAEGHSFTVGYNPAMEYSISELAGLVVPKGWRNKVKFDDMSNYLAATESSFDWRSVPGVTMSVKNQRSCGSCWAFSTVAPLETLIGFHCGATVDLSEQYLVSCNQSGWGCQGGWFAHDYHEWYVPTSKGEAAAGAVLETAMPYLGYNSACNGPNAHPYKISDWRFIGGNTVPPTGAIKQAVQTYGPVSVGVCVGSKFQAYTGGVFGYNETCSGTVNHAVALVGWKDEPDAVNGYWILKNSWGTGWGESGYMRIRYGTSKVGYAANYVDFSEGNCPNSPAPCQFDCASATVIPLTTVPASLSRQMTDGGQTGTITYGCSGQSETGPRKIFKVTTTSTGDLSAALSNTAGANLDVAILKSCSPSSCAAFGDTTATYVNAAAGTYYIVVDTASGAAGSFDLTVNLARPLPDLNATWVRMTSYSGGKMVYGTLKVSNTGNAKAGAFRVGYYLSTDGGATPGTLLGSQSVASLAAGRYTYLYPFLRSTTSLTSKYIIARVDFLGAVVEKDEVNNLANYQVKLKR